MQQLLSEPMGIKYTIGGFIVWFFTNVDITQVLGFVGLVIGLVIQFASFIRNRKMEKLQDEADKRSREADERDKLQYDLQMRVLAKELAKIEKRTSDDNK